MKSIIKPTYNIKDVFRLCISTVDDINLKRSYENCLSILEEAETDFDAKFISNEIYKIQQTHKITEEIGKDELVKLYTYRMLHKDQPSRKYYDKIIATAPDSLCPYCLIREADTIDHYLPKTKYPIFSVCPLNLVPSCSICNTDKKVDYPKSNIDQLLHPYYDKVDDESWIKAIVIQNNPVSITYYAAPPETCDDTTKQRILNHFDSYGLAELYSSNANRRLRGDKKMHNELFNNSQEELKKHLRSSYTSNLELGINSYEAVLYRTLLNDNWYCSVGAGY